MTRVKAIFFDVIFVFISGTELEPLVTGLLRVDPPYGLGVRVWQKVVLEKNFVSCLLHKLL
jgi:hypothetical protein